MEEKPKAPGLRWRSGKPIWRATRAAIAAGYPVKWVNLSHMREVQTVISRCRRLQAEMLAWQSGRRVNPVAFDGTIKSLVRIYQNDEESPYQKLKPSSRHPYDVYARMLMMDVGTKRIDHVDGRDLRRWFNAWSEPEKPGNARKIAAARMAMTVLKVALSYGKTCRLDGCAELKAIMDEIEFPCPTPRTEAPSADDIAKVRASAHAAGHPLAALAYAMQFETAMRQWDVIGQWLPLSDPRPSTVLQSTVKWIGPTWAQIDENLIFTVTPTKTEGTTGRRVSVDLKACPMVMEELARIPNEARRGALIVNPATGLPYRQEYYRELWRENADAAEIPRSVWNRDLRAGAATEARQAGAATDDVARLAGHNRRTTARVYDRDTLEAARRVASARTSYRAKTGPERSGGQ